MRLALIGFGGLGRIVAAAVRNDSGIELVAVAARERQRADVLAMLGAVPVVQTAESLISARPELVVECAGHEAFRQYAEPVLAAGIGLVAVSVGVLADAEYRERVLKAARAGKSALEIPAGAIGGVDAVAAARNAGLTRVLYVTRKNPEAWRGTPAESMVDLGRVRTPLLFFDSDAAKAALLFKSKANITATLALAGLGFEATRVQFWVDPAVTTSVHRIFAEGPCGSLEIDLHNEASPTDGKASLLAAMSIVRAIRSRTGVLRV